MGAIALAMRLAGITRAAALETKLQNELGQIIQTKSVSHATCGPNEPWPQRGASALGRLTAVSARPRESVHRSSGSETFCSPLRKPLWRKDRASNDQRYRHEQIANIFDQSDS